MLFNSLRLGILCFVGWMLVISSVTARDAKARFELMHLWITDEEALALTALSTPIKKAGVIWEEHQHATGFFDMQQEYAKRVALGYPPTGVFWIGGYGLRQLVDDGLFRLIKDIPGKSSFEETLLPEVYKVVKHKKGITTLPVGIHMQNHMVYNKDIFQQLGLVVPKTWEQLINDLSRIRAAGFTPITMSDQRWQIRFLFFSILSAKLTATELISFLDEQKNMQQWRPQIVDALSILDKLRPFVNSDNKDLNWAVSIDHLTSGKAAINFLANFSSILYPDDKRFVCDLPPGNNYIIWSFDSIALTNTSDPIEVAGQDAMISVAHSIENLQKYVGWKGGVPVHKWKNEQGINRCSLQSIEKWKQTKDKIHTSSVWAQSFNVIAIIVQKFWRNGGAGSIQQAADEMVHTLINLHNQKIKK
ncbi:MAG: carbohydrate ABC transporter substrate-binding protein [Methylococcales bacterium]|nr:carbohydrate ABC transporter substrate-binding protein [Methylococcales bacterium]